MQSLKLNRQNMLLGAGAAVASVTGSPFAMAAPQTRAPGERDPTPVPPTPDQVRRMKWWHEAKFGMFIHFGLYAQHARHEWAMETEASS